MSLTKVSYSMINGAPVNVIDYGVVGNGIVDDTAALQLAVNSGNSRVYINNPVYINGTFSSPASVTLEFGDSGNLILGGSGTIDVYGPVVANQNPFSYTNNSAAIKVWPVTINVPADYSTVQKAVDAVPTYLWQRFMVKLANGTYNEDLRIESKFGADLIVGNPTPNGGRPVLQITGANGTARDSAVKLKSVTVNNCHGSTYHPSIDAMTITGTSPYDSSNLNSAIIFFGSTSGAVNGISFEGTGAFFCVTSYGSDISVDNCNFGTDINNSALNTKQNGRILCAQDAVIVPGTTNSIGRVLGPVVTSSGGAVTAANLSNVTTLSFDEVETTGVHCGTMYDSLGGYLAGPRFFNQYLSSWQSYFPSLAEFESSFTAGAAATFVSNQGLNLTTTAGNFGAFWIRRNFSIAENQNLLEASQMIAAVSITSITGDGAFEIGTKGSASQDGYGMRLTTNGLVGFFANASGGAEIVTTPFATYAQCVGKSFVFYMAVKRNGSCIFKAVDASYNKYKGALPPNTVTGTSSYMFFTSANSTVTGTVNVTLAEARIARF
jgi:hypothetical protein